MKLTINQTNLLRKVARGGTTQQEVDANGNTRRTFHSLYKRGLIVANSLGWVVVTDKGTQFLRDVG